ncbi:hypothetical protein ACVW0P_000408 [Mucilaginibacter sp. UYNi724]
MKTANRINSRSIIPATPNGASTVIFAALFYR